MAQHAPVPAPAPRRIGLVGGEGTGKTTLASALAVALPACVVDESLRAFVEREGRTPRADEQQRADAASRPPARTSRRTGARIRGWSPIRPPS